MTMVPVTDQCEHFCIIYSEPIDPFPVSVPFPCSVNVPQHDLLSATKHKNVRKSSLPFPDKGASSLQGLITTQAFYISMTQGKFLWLSVHFKFKEKNYTIITHDLFRYSHVSLHHTCRILTGTVAFIFVAVLSNMGFSCWLKWHLKWQLVAIYFR